MGTLNLLLSVLLPETTYQTANADRRHPMPQRYEPMISSSAPRSAATVERTLADRKTEEAFRQFDREH